MRQRRDDDHKLAYRYRSHKPSRLPPEPSVDSGLDVVQANPRALPLDARALRGLPCIGGRGSLGGAILGSRPGDGLR